MPTASEFDMAAAKFDQAADMLHQLPNAPKAHFGPDVLTGGVLTDQVRDTIVELTDVSAQTAILAEDRAETCRARADECRRHQALKDQYSDALTIYEENLRLYNQAVAAGATTAEPPIAPTPPPTPPAWVELT